MIRRSYRVPRIGVAIVVVGALASVSLGTSAAVAKTSGAQPKGEPFKLMVVAPETGSGYTFPQARLGARAAAKAINDAGGLKDPKGGPNRPIKIVGCDTKFDPNEVTACGRKASAEGVLAMVGSQPTGDDELYDILNKAGIPAIGDSSGSTASLTSPNSYNFYSGVVTIFGMVQAAKAAGAKSVTPVIPDLPVAEGLLEPLGTFAKSIGMAVNDPVKLAVSAVDMASYAAQGLSSGGAQIIVTPGDQALSYVNALLQAGADLQKTPVLTLGVFMNSKLLKELQGSSKGLIAVGEAWPVDYLKNPAVKRYHVEMNKLGDKKTVRDEVGLMSWASVHLIADKLVPLMEDFTAAELTAAVQKVGPVTYDPLMPFDWSKNAVTTGLLGALKTPNKTVMITRSNGKTLVPVVKGFVDYDEPFTIKGG
jgi:ABC-type branched-subunit amino acid transport system substrate-binding protein